jgi:Na+/H+ antiporter NhaD/arsenite permease-like protein
MEGRTIHSQFLQLLADEGYVGLTFYLLTLLSFFFNSWRTRQRLKGRADPHSRKIIAMLNGLESSMAMFCVGGLFLSLEVFELPYLLILIGAQLALIVRRDLAPVSQEAVEAPTPFMPRAAAVAMAQPARFTRG